VLRKAYETSDGTYGQLPGQDDLGMLDGLAVGTTFTTVGYGLQTAYPRGTPPDEFLTQAERLRMIAMPELRQYYGDFALLLSNNSNTGGTCFGDSGGPSFYDGVLVAVTSFALTETCSSHGGVYRLDTADDLDWLYGTFGRHL
jgi:hypothetical protein